ncbi:hypothetical protein [Nostoc sp.]
MQRPDYNYRYGSRKRKLRCGDGDRIHSTPDYIHGYLVADYPTA